MHTLAPLWLWFVFAAVVLAALVIDFVVLKKQGAHAVSVPETWRDGLGLVHAAVGTAMAALLWWHRRPAVPHPAQPHAAPGSGSAPSAH